MNLSKKHSPHAWSTWRNNGSVGTATPRSPRAPRPRTSTAAPKASSSPPLSLQLGQLGQPTEITVGAVVFGHSGGSRTIVDVLPDERSTWSGTKVAYKDDQGAPGSCTARSLRRWATQDR